MGTLRGGDGSEEMREATRAALDAGGGGAGSGGLREPVRAPGLEPVGTRAIEAEHANAARAAASC